MDWRNSLTKLDKQFNFCLDEMVKIICSNKPEAQLIGNVFYDQEMDYFECWGLDAYFRVVEQIGE